MGKLRGLVIEVSEQVCSADEFGDAAQTKTSEYPAQLAVPGIEEIEDIVHTAYRKFYFRPRYVMKRIKSIRSMADFTRYVEGFLFLKGF